MKEGKKVVAKKINYVFERVEKKYLLDREKYDLLIKYIEDYMTEDEYGVHTICNIYYDTDTYDLIRHSIEKCRYKEKLRVRSYGSVDKRDCVFIEIKKKYKGVVFKRRVSMTLDEAERYLNSHIKPKKQGQILKEIDYFIEFYKPKPKVYLAYERVAYFGKKDKNIRITFDKNIRSRDYDLSLCKGNYGTNLLDENLCLMEIKVPMAMPLWLTRILNDLEIYPTSFSKYGNIYRQNILNNGREQACLQAY